MFCKMCGRQIPDDSVFCNACGARVQSDSSNDAQNQNHYGYNPAPNPVPGTSSDDGVKVVSALAYLGILFFLPLVVYPQSSFGRFHANQGLVLLIAEIACGSVAGILKLMGSFPVIGWMFSLFGGLLYAATGICILVLMVLGIANAVGGKMQKLPVIGEFTLIR